MGGDRALGGSLAVVLWRLPLLPLAGVSMEHLRPGLRLLVTFEGEPGWHHERVLLYPWLGDQWIILMPDGDEYAEALGWWNTRSVLTGKEAYPAEAIGRLVQFREPIDDETLLEVVVRARKMAAKELRLRPGVVPPPSQAVALSWDGTPLAIPRRTVGECIARRFGRKEPMRRSLKPKSGAVPESKPSKPPAADPEHDGESTSVPGPLRPAEGKIWQLPTMDRSDDYMFGQTLTELPSGSVMRGEYALAKMGVGCLWNRFCLVGRSTVCMMPAFISTGFSA